MTTLKQLVVMQKTQFSEVYRRSIEDILRFWTPEMQAEIAKHCYPWRLGATDFRAYLIASETRFWIAYRSLCQAGEFKSLCDIGGFFGAFALTLARMGYTITITETLEYYSQLFVPLFQFLRDNGVRIVDYNPFESISVFKNEFDVVTVMAVLEHYPHSPQKFMENILQMVKFYGKIYIEVPNIAYWPKRKSMLFGQTPLVLIRDIYHSFVPFIGHHHEYTLDEVYDLASLSKLQVLEANLYNYSFRGPWFKRLMSEPSLFCMSLLPRMRETIAILAKRYE